MKELVAEMQAFLGLSAHTNDSHSESRETTSEPDKIGHLNDVCRENRILNQCGLGLSPEEAYLVYTSLKSFNKTHSATNTRFWGKVFGVERNYYVVETETEEKELDEQANLEVNLIKYPNEKRGEGINTKEHWVTTELTKPDKWVKLPLVTRQQMREARNIKYIFKGNLEHNIVSSPVFSGLEKHMVGRIWTNG